MAWRGLGVAALLAALGVGVGVVVGMGLRPSVSAIDEARPLPAESPAVPIDPPPKVVPDPPKPPTLRPGLPTREVTVGGRAFGVTVPVPSTWARFDIGAAEARWTLPGNPPHSFSVRVEMVGSERNTVVEMMSERSEDLDGLPDFTILESTDDTLVFSYIDETRHRRLQLLRWLDLRTPGSAEVELAVVGRVRDQAGLEDLLAVVTEGARIPSS
ncbi:MAG: hypothetical protein ACRDOM_02575 [Nocardioides sp.]